MLVGIRWIGHEDLILGFQIIGPHAVGVLFLIVHLSESQLLEIAFDGTVTIVGIINLQLVLVAVAQQF